MAYDFPNDAYDEVRSAISTEIDAVILPDATLSSSIHEGEAERFIERNLTQAQIDNAAYAEEIRYAAILFLSSLVAPKIRLVDYEKIAGGAISYSKIDLNKISATNLELANSRIQDILMKDSGESANQLQNPNIFKKAKRRFRPRF